MQSKTALGKDHATTPADTKAGTNAPAEATSASGSKDAVAKAAPRKRSTSPRKAKPPKLTSTGLRASGSASPAGSTNADSISATDQSGSTSGLTRQVLQSRGSPNIDAASPSGASAKPSNMESPSTDAAGDDMPRTSTKQRSRREAVVSRRASQQQSPGPQASVTLPSYHQLEADMPEQQLPLTPEGVRAIQRHMTAFRGSAHVQDQSLALYVNSQVSALIDSE